MRPAHRNMYAQPTCMLPPNPVHCFTSANSPPQFLRNPQDAQQPQQLQPVYLVPQMHQYPAHVGVLSQVVGNPIPQAMAIQGVQAGWAYRSALAEATPMWDYSARGYNEQQEQEPKNWPPAASQGVPAGLVYRPAMAEAAPMWGYGARGYNEQQKQEPRSWPPAPPQGYPGPGGSFQGRAEGAGHGNGSDDPGCSFLASGKVVKEHKPTAHSKSSNPLPTKAALRTSAESNGEIRAWREERKGNYPTRLNIQHKKEILEGKVARGELIDKDSRQRRQRMKVILAKQAELGVPVAEVPAYYLSHKHEGARHWKNSDRNSKQTSRPTTNEIDSRKRKLVTEEQPSTSACMNTSNTNAELPTQPECKLTEEVKDVLPDSTRQGDKAAGSQPSEIAARTQCYFYQRGRCRKGNKCHFAHTHGKKGGDEGRGRHQKTGVVENKRPPTLLSKLLQSEITRDKSNLLQCLRFFVTNNFLLDGIVQQALESDMVEREESPEYSEGEVVEAPDVLLADWAILNTLLSERPEVLIKVVEME